MRKQVFYYFLFYLLSIFIETVFISIVAFFHFLLDHHFRIIEEWVTDHGWFIIVFSKCLSFFFIHRFFSVKREDVTPYKNIFKRGFQKPRYEFLVSTFGFLITIFLFGRPEWNFSDQAGFFSVLTNTGFVFIFYMIDIVLINSLNYFLLPENPIKTLKPILTFSVIFYLGNGILMIFGRNYNYLVFFHFLYMLFLIYWAPMSWTYPALYLLLLVCPLASLTDLNPLWGDQYAIVKMSSTIGPGEITVLILLSLSYLLLKRRVVKWISPQFLNFKG